MGEVKKYCMLDLTEVVGCGNGIFYRVWECSECGKEHEEVNGEYEFCPHCGKKVLTYFRGQFSKVNLLTDVTDSDTTEGATDSGSNE